jgi:hypothetical protein
MIHVKDALATVPTAGSIPRDPLTKVILMSSDNIVQRKDLADRLRNLADDVESPDSDIKSADPDLRDTLLGMVDSLYCKSFPDEDPEYDGDEDDEE